jgi:hypothetical protein
MLRNGAHRLALTVGAAFRDGVVTVAMSALLGFGNGT